MARLNAAAVLLLTAAALPLAGIIIIIMPAPTHGEEKARRARNAMHRGQAACRAVVAEAAVVMVA